MPFSIRFAPGLGIRPKWRERAAAVLRDISAALEHIPDDSGYWRAVKGGVAELNLGAWRFEYIVDPDDGRIEVIRARRIDEAAAGRPGARPITAGT